MAEDWRVRAACRGRDTETFFPIGSKGPAARQIRRAKAVCADCSVRAQCLEYALASRQDSGVWGGKSEDERLAIVRRQQRQRAAGSGSGSHVDAVRLARVLEGQYQGIPRETRREAVRVLGRGGTHTVFGITRLTGYNTATVRAILAEANLLGNVVPAGTIAS